MNDEARLDAVLRAACDPDNSGIVDDTLRVLIGSADSPVSQEVARAHMRDLTRKVRDGDPYARGEGMRLVLLTHDVLVKYAAMARDMT